ncbi:unnamed protein product [Ostreobium quekettii]|uniref:Trimethylguanosine synthase n=1 Tax=Ostreobium quekettii TaxID=121088 RepID=A0A8S1IM32_9CHLO|nr:unnamed protein product [Ostreobium quekettii]|eukprot:evm.model.scf_553.1 EVM.evm.TU.scf_553.1   scf_553:21236-21973(-)
MDGASGGVGVAGGAVQGPGRPWVSLKSCEAALARQAVPRRLFKYWLQRYCLFSRYDEGVQMDSEGWYSATPEVVAAHQARACRGDLIVDAFTGVGGNAIQFAAAGASVLAFDLSPSRIELARRNAEVYGVAGRIDFICGDFFSAGRGVRADVVFLSPPWGGPSYAGMECVDVGNGRGPLAEMVGRAVRAARKMTDGRGTVVLFLPKNTNLIGLRGMAGHREDVRVEVIVVNGAVKALTVYLEPRR